MFIIPIAWIGLSILAAVIASNKGRSAVLFFLFSLLLSPLIGLIAAMVAKPKVDNVERRQIEAGAMKKCPFCAEVVRAEASVCRYCGREFDHRTTAGEMRGIVGDDGTGLRLPLPADELADVREFVRGGKKSEAIQLLMGNIQFGA